MPNSILIVVSFFTGHKMAEGGTVYSIDLQRVIEDEIWERYLRCKSFIQRPFSNKHRKRYYFEINWGAVDFDSKTIRYNPRPQPGSFVPAEIGTGTTNTHVSGNVTVTTAGTGTDVTDVSDMSPGKKAKGKEVDLYETVYENATYTDQKYTLITHKETKKTVSVEFSKGFTKGTTTSIAIPTPDGIPSVGAGTSDTLSVTKSKGQTFEETMSWDVNTEITVGKGQRLTATLAVSEDTKMIDFEVETTMKIIDGECLSVTLRRVSNGESVQVFSIADLETVFAKLKDTSGGIIKALPTYTYNNIIKSSVVLVTHGTCKSVSWRNQQVKVNCDRLEGWVDISLNKGGTQDTSTSESDGDVTASVPANGAT